MYEDYEKFRDIKGVRDADVSKATGIHPSTFSDWKKGKSSPKIQKLQLLADYFGITVEELNGGEPSNFYKHPTDISKGAGIIDVESQICLRNELLHHMLLAGGKIVGDHPEVIEAMIYTLEKLGEKK